MALALETRRESSHDTPMRRRPSRGSLVGPRGGIAGRLAGLAGWLLVGPVLAGSALGLWPRAAAAEGLVTTATAQVLVSDPRGVGGGGSLALASELGAIGERGAFRLGGVFGGAAITSDDAQVVRTYGSVGPHAELAFALGSTELALRLAVGLWAGALDERLRAGGWSSGGLWWCLFPSDDVRVGVGLDVSWVFGPGDEIVVYAPGVTVAWTLTAPEGAW